MKNYRAVIRDTLKSVQSDIPYDIKMAFPESKPAGNLITFYEITNTGTELACVDVIAYQVDLWFMTLPDLLELTEKVDEALTSLGLIRQFAFLGRAFTRPQRLFAQIIALRSSGRHKNQSID